MGAPPGSATRAAICANVCLSAGPQGGLTNGDVWRPRERLSIWTVDRFHAKRLAFLIGLIGVVADPARSAAAPACPATRADALGPFYRPNAPVRSSVGKGYVLSGTVRSSADCAAIPGARVELWLAGPNGYDDDHRATVIAGADGRYRFESEMPGRYERRPPHIHVRVAHERHQTLVTQHYPAQGQAGGTFDLVLTPAASRSIR